MVSSNSNNSNKLPKMPKEAIVKPEGERPVKEIIRPEEVESKDEAEYERMKSTENDMDSDDNPDFDPEV